SVVRGTRRALLRAAPRIDDAPGGRAGWNSGRLVRRHSGAHRRVLRPYVLSFAGLVLALGRPLRGVVHELPRQECLRYGSVLALVLHADPDVPAHPAGHAVPRGTSEGLVRTRRHRRRDRHPSARILLVRSKSLEAAGVRARLRATRRITRLSSVSDDDARLHPGSRPGHSGEGPRTVRAMVQDLDSGGTHVGGGARGQGSPSAVDQSHGFKPRGQPHRCHPALPGGLAIRCVPIIAVVGGRLSGVVRDPGSGVSGIRFLDPPPRVLRDDDPAKGRRDPPVLFPAFRPPTVAASGSPGGGIGSDGARAGPVSGVRGPWDAYSTR